MPRAHANLVHRAVELWMPSLQSLAAVWMALYDVKEVRE